MSCSARGRPHLSRRRRFDDGQTCKIPDFSVIFVPLRCPTPSSPFFHSFYVSHFQHFIFLRSIPHTVICFMFVSTCNMGASSLHCTMSSTFFTNVHPCSTFYTPFTHHAIALICFVLLCCALKRCELHPFYFYFNTFIFLKRFCTQIPSPNTQIRSIFTGARSFGAPIGLFEHEWCLERLCSF